MHKMEKMTINRSGYNITEAKVIHTRNMTEQEKLFEISLLKGESLDYDPGQFVEVSLFGAGEAPISICSSPTKKGTFELCVRAVGRFTDAMHKLEMGDILGIRGPFGVGFPVEVLEGYDLLLIAGGLGIAPLRSLINYVIDNRRDFGKVHIMLGAKNPESMLFGNELETWEERMDVNFQSTVDNASPGWDGDVGLITSLIPPVNINPARTFAVVVGPPIMYKFVINELKKKDIPDNRILVSLERHMKCGLGKCGHCQIHDIYCCQDGPVFFYDQIKDLKGAI